MAQSLVTALQEIVEVWRGMKSLTHPHLKVSNLKMSEFLNLRQISNQWFAYSLTKNDK